MYAAALAVPKYDESPDGPVSIEADQAGRVLISVCSDVETVDKMTDKIADILDQMGAGHARADGGGVPRQHRGRYLRASARRVQRDMKAAAADSCTSRVDGDVRDQQGLGRSTTCVRWISPAKPGTTSRTAARCAA